MLFENFSSNIKILTVLKLSWNSSDADAAPRKFHAISFRVKGNAHYQLEKSEIHSTSGDILFVPEDVGYHITAEEEELFVIHFEMPELKQDMMEVFHATDYYKVKGLFTSCYEEWNKKEPGYYLKVLSIFFHIRIKPQNTLTNKINTVIIIFGKGIHCCYPVCNLIKVLIIFNSNHYCCIVIS